jgi:hypothetical protein
VWVVDIKKAKKDNSTLSTANDIAKSSILRLALELGEDGEKLLSTGPKLVFVSSNEEPYIKYEDTTNTLTIVGDGIEDKFIKMVTNGVIASHRFREKQKKRLQSDMALSDNSATESLLKLGFVAVFGIIASPNEEKSSMLAGNIFKRGELADIQSLKEMLLLTHKNIVSGKFEEFALGVVKDGDAEAADLMGRILATAVVLSCNGDMRQALKSIYYNGYNILKQIGKIDQTKFVQYVDMLFSNNAS